MSASTPSGNPRPPAAAPRRTTGRGVGGVVLLLVAAGLLYTGVSAVADPSAALVGTSNSARSADTEAEAQIGGLLMCGFGISVLCFGIGLLKKKADNADGPRPGA
ncbi:hypothetical protein [Streptomyces sp. Da 82-17]|uniref:hypothetical protein n=1 Tax=Streptomyces sp. Da 82-17 TaxID=3377116 RepID=UPI0038D4CE69